MSRDPRVDPKPGDVLQLDMYGRYKTRTVTFRKLALVEYENEAGSFADTLFRWMADMDDFDAEVIHAAD